MSAGCGSRSSRRPVTRRNTSRTPLPTRRGPENHCSCSPAGAGRCVPEPLPLAIDDVRAALAGDAQLIDLRAPAEHALAHVPGSLSIPSGSSFGTWLGWVVEPDRPLVLMLDDPADWEDAVRQAL